MGDKQFHRSDKLTRVRSKALDSLKTAFPPTTAVDLQSQLGVLKEFYDVTHITFNVHKI